MNKVYFVSNNERKFHEVERMFDFTVEWYQKYIPELQTNDVEKLIKAKALEAFQVLRRPILVEHTAFRIHAFNNLPGLQTSYFYSEMGYQAIVDYCTFKNDFGASAETIICYCDGKSFTIGRGVENGCIKDPQPSSGDAFGWDKIFSPQDDNEEMLTYAELNDKKNSRSMRKRACEDLKEKLKNVCSVSHSSERKLEKGYMKELAQLIKEKKVLLFLGAGISASLDFPSWDGLIGDLGHKLGFERELFETYGDKLMLAEYANISCKEVYDHLKDTFSLSRNENTKTALRDSDIYKALLDLDFPVIYTTNYDRLIEEYYKQNNHKHFSVVNIGDMEKANANSGYTRIMKFHGDIECQKSIVLSESQYFSRMDFQSFLDVQLQADLLRYHVLYLGYSLSDINIKLMLYLARKRWQQSGGEKLSYIFTATPNMIQKKVFASNGIVTFNGDTPDKKLGTLEFLNTLLAIMKDIP